MATDIPGPDDPAPAGSSPGDKPIIAVFNSSGDTVDMLRTVLEAQGFHTVPGHITDYIRRVTSLSGVKAWVEDALAEKDFLDFEEPYRTAR